MNSFSTTQTTNLVALAGVIVMVLNHFNINIGSDEVSTLLGALFTIGGIVANWYHRYSKGDLTVVGSRK